MCSAKPFFRGRGKKRRMGLRGAGYLVGKYKIEVLRRLLSPGAHLRPLISGAYFNKFFRSGDIKGAPISNFEKINVYRNVGQLPKIWTFTAGVTR